MNNKYACIMAGGKGERFWPESRESRPKQLLNLFSDKSLIEMTVARIKQFIPLENIFIITNQSYVEKIHSLLPAIPAENIIGEPARRDTAPCVALAAGMVAAKNPDAVMTLLPADHMIVDHNAFEKDLMLAFENAADHLYTLGIAPTFPSSDYGYIEAECKEKISPVVRFVEKPERSKAEAMLAKGNFYWNSGIFVWKVKTILNAFQMYMPELAVFAEKTAQVWSQPDFKNFLNNEFPKLPKISIDYAVMEKSSNIKVIKASFDWNDVGNWHALRAYLEPDSSGNIAKGEVHLMNSKDNIVFCNNQKLLIAGIDLEDMLIVHTDDAVLVCPNSSVAKLKELLQEIGEQKKFENYL